MLESPGPVEVFWRLEAPASPGASQNIIKSRNYLLGTGVLMFDARKRACEWIFLDARNRRVLMLGNGRLNF